MKAKITKIIPVILITAIMIVYYLLFFFVIVNLIHGVCRILLGIIPLVLSVVMLHVCAERIKEIKKGEDDDLSQY